MANQGTSLCDITTFKDSGLIYFSFFLLYSPLQEINQKPHACTQQGAATPASLGSVQSSTHPHAALFGEVKEQL